MTNRTTKSALLMSALALLLCIAMLTGTTFAWFTDEVTSGNNIIKSGNLDIELEYWNGTEWKDVSGSSEILDKDALWEPGYTKVAYLKLTNAGSLALQYQLGINIISELEGKDVKGNTFKLSDYIQFGVVENVNGETSAYANREDAIAAVTSAKKISAGYSKASTMAAEDDSLYLALVVYMPDIVGNEANHDGENIPQINLGINVVATQVGAESDSFGPDYDADAIYTDFIVTNEAELVAALAEAGEFDVIGIKGNVTWTTGAGIGSSPFIETATYALKAPTKNITLLGLGDDATFTAIGQGVGAIGIDGGTVTFKNLKIVDESVSYAENSWEYGYLEFRGNTVFENCDIVNAIMMEGDSASFKNCSFNSYDANQYAVWVSDGDVTFENCDITGARGIKVHEAYGSKVGTVVINNNKFINLTKKPGLAIGTVDADTAISITNNVFAGTQAGDQGNFMYETDTDVATFNFTDDNNEVVSHGATNKDQLKAALNTKDATVYLAEGTYAMGGSFSVKEGVTIVGDENVVIEGTLTSTMNNVTIKNVTIKGSNAQRWAYAKGSVVFENCTFEGNGVYAIHYDGTSGADILYKNCKIVGWVAITGGHNSLTFDGCEIYGNGTYGVIRTYGDATVKNCTFDVDNVNTTDVYQDGLHAVDCTITVENCTNKNGDIADLFNTSSGGKFVLDGAKVVSSAEEFKNSFNSAGAGDVIDASGVVVEGTTALNKPGVTVIGATFKNENGIAVRETISGTYKDCVFEGSEALRWCYTKAGDTVVFENCVIKTDFRGVHFDGMDGNVIFKNCEINGFNAIGGEGTVTFEGCTFGNDKSSYNGLNMYSNINLVNCTFNYVSGKTNFIDMEGTGKTLSITNCKAFIDGVETDISGFVGGSKLAQNTVVIK